MLHEKTYNNDRTVKVKKKTIKSKELTRSLYKIIANLNCLFELRETKMDNIEVFYLLENPL